jgi:5-bromo-4-chloroindolyl phosphate hydrolysis protein
MNTESDNLVRLDQWKNSKRDSSFSDYLKVLSFNDLMNESTDLLDQMRKSEESDNLFSKTRVMMNEFTHRLEKESRHLADSVKDLKKQIEDKLH